MQVLLLDEITVDLDVLHVYCSSQADSVDCVDLL
jgi:hypothetical protein